MEFQNCANHLSSCHKSIELHDKRHREIAAIIQAIQEIDGDASPLYNRKRKDKKKDEPDLPNLEAEANQADDVRDVEWDNNSSTLNEDDPEERKPQWNADANKATKIERKMAKNQVRFSVIAKEDLDRIQEALHPYLKDPNEREEVSNGQGLVDNRTIEQNIIFNRHCFKYGSLRQGVHEKKSLKNNGSPNVEARISDYVDENLPTIPNALGVQTIASKASKERKRLDTKLRNAIVNDLVAFENEQAETMERMAGYWRYANRRTYSQMVENNELWDWATGQKLLKVEEESELDVIEEEDEETEDSTLDGMTLATTPLQSPENWDDDFEFSAGSDSLLDQKGTSIEEDGLKTPTQVTLTYDRSNTEDSDEIIRSRFDDFHIDTLSYSPGRSPGPTITFRVPSPCPSDDSYGEDWKFLEDYYEDDVVIKAKTRPRTPLATMTPNRKPPAFDGVKDNRSFGGAFKIRQASPPQENKPAPTPRAWRKAPSPSMIPPNCNGDVNNQFAALNHEVPAPRDEPKKPKPQIQAKIMNLALPPNTVLPLSEEGWQVQGNPVKGAPVPKINTKDYPALKEVHGTKAPHMPKKAAVHRQAKKPVATSSNVTGGATWAAIAAGPAKRRL